MELQSEPPPLPYFLPVAAPYHELPEPVRVALDSIVQPAYDELVVDAPNALERSASTSLVFLLTLEVLAQFGLAQSALQQTLAGEVGDESKAINQHLRVITAKQKVSSFLNRLKAAREMATPANQGAT